MTNEMTMTVAEETKQNAIALSADVVATSIDLNQVQADAQSEWQFRAHYVDLAKGDKGDKPLICRILKEQQAVFPRHAESTALRPIVVATSLFASEILERKEAIFGPNRYNANTIQCDLRTLRLKGIVAMVKLSPAEDANRPSGKNGQIKPRRKYFLLESVDKGETALADSGATVDIGTEAEQA